MALATTAYGRAVSFKTLLFKVLLGSGNANPYRHLPSLAAAATRPRHAKRMTTAHRLLVDPARQRGPGLPSRWSSSSSTRRP
jgi:putative copper export protein